MDATPAKPAPIGLPAARTGTAGPEVVLVHGFTQTGASWSVVAADLAADHRVVVVDAPGHGRAGEIRASLSEGADLLGATGGRAIYVGYSMGGRLALRLALDRPDLVAGLVLLGATAGIDDPIERADRRNADGALATRVEADGTGAFLQRWLAQPLFDGLGLTAEDRAARMANDPAGLASSLRLAGTGSMDPPWWDDLDRLDMATLVLAGSRDHKFSDLGRRLATAIGPTARFEEIPLTRHAAHLEAPAAFAARIRAFARELASTS